MATYRERPAAQEETLWKILFFRPENLTDLFMRYKNASETVAALSKDEQFEHFNSMVKTWPGPRITQFYGKNLLSACNEQFMEFMMDVSNPNIPPRTLFNNPYVDGHEAKKAPVDPVAMRGGVESYIPEPTCTYERPKSVTFKPNPRTCAPDPFITPSKDARPTMMSYGGVTSTFDDMQHVGNPYDRGTSYRINQTVRPVSGQGVYLAMLDPTMRVARYEDKKASKKYRIIDHFLYQQHDDNAGYERGGNANELSQSYNYKLPYAGAEYLAGP